MTLTVTMTRRSRSPTPPNKTLKNHRLLYAMPTPPPPASLASLKSHFPDLEIIYAATDFSNVFEPQDWRDVYPEEEWQKVTILVTRTIVPTREGARRLQLIQLQSAGTDAVVNQPIYRDEDVIITTASGVHGPQISEWIISTYLALSIELPAYLEQQKAGRWKKDRRADAIWRDDSVGRRIGILGYGAIGRQTARLATAMGFQVYAYTLHPRNTPESRRDKAWSPPGLGDPEGTLPSKWFSGASREEVHRFLGSGLDLLVLSVPLTDQTRHLIGKEELEILGNYEQHEEGSGDEKVRRKAFISNVGRGAIINTDDLIGALNQDVIRGAALDVTDPEPLPDGHPLFAAKNLIVTPHISGQSSSYYERVLAITQENLTRWTEGRKLLNEVNRKDGY